MTFIVSFVEIEGVTERIVAEISGGRVTSSMAAESGDEMRTPILSIRTVARSGFVLGRGASHERWRHDIGVGRNGHPPVVVVVVVVAVTVLTEAAGETKRRFEDLLERGW